MISPVYGVAKIANVLYFDKSAADLSKYLRVVYLQT